MKNYSLLLLILLNTCTIYARRQEVYSRSYMITRPVYQHVGIDDATWHNVIFGKRGKHLGSFQLFPTYQQSIGNCRTMLYFLPDRKTCPINPGEIVSPEVRAGWVNRQTCLLVSGDDNTADLGCRDVRAEWLGLPQNFRGFMRINPTQHQIAIPFEYHQGLGNIVDAGFLKDSWVSVLLPLVYIKNEMNLTQCDVTNASDKAPYDIVGAFQQNSWCFDKIVHKRSTTNLAEIVLRLGQNFMDEENYQLAYYSGISLPSGNKQNPTYLFDAVTGKNGHVAINAGVKIQFLLNRDPERVAVCFFINVDDMWVIRHHQCRTFDLKDKPWSRFMLFNRKCCEQEAVPGVNVLSCQAVVRPYNQADFSMGWRLRSKHVECEIGYDLWGHGEEHVKIRYHDEFPKEYGIQGSEVGKTASQSTINSQAPDDTQFVTITSDDLNLTSAAAGSALNHTAHFALGTLYHGKHHDTFFGIGSFYEYAQKNGALKTWGVWAKLGSSF